MKIANSQGLAAGWLLLGAAPTFALMAALTGILGHGAPEMLCSAMPQASALDGMVPMYVLMSVFHVAPWLKFVSSWRSGVCAGGTHESEMVRSFAKQPCRSGRLA